MFAPRSIRPCAIEAVLVALAVVGLGGCASPPAPRVGLTGTMHANVRETGARVSIHYTEAYRSDRLEVEVFDEVFTGRVVEAGGSLATSSGGAVGGGGSYGGGALFGGTSSYGASAVYTGRFVGVLLGSRGRTMRCDLQYADKRGATHYGGMGVCTVGGGGTLDVTW